MTRVTPGMVFETSLGLLHAGARRAAAAALPVLS
jgi:hypothetical protein